MSDSSPSDTPSPERKTDALLQAAEKDADAPVPHAVQVAVDQMELLQRRYSKERKKRKKAEKKAKTPKSGGSLGTSRGIETMFRTSYRTHVDLSHLADNKANIMISINGIIISILLASISPKIDANPWLLLPTSILLIGCMVSMIYAILAARPRVSSHTISLEDVYEDRANILFFGNFVTLEQDDFVEGMKSLMNDTDQLYVNMTRDIYSLGQVLATKFRLLRIAYNVFMFGLVIGVASFIAVFLSVVTSATPAAGTLIP